VLRYSSIRIAMVLPCTLTRLHKSSDVSFAGAMAKMEKTNKNWGKEEEQEVMRGSTRHLYSAPQGGPDWSLSPSNDMYHGKPAHSLALA
jgi:hypothetical protein